MGNESTLQTRIRGLFRVGEECLATSNFGGAMRFQVRGYVYSMREGLELKHAERTIDVPDSGVPKGQMEEFIREVRSLKPKDYPIAVRVSFTVTMVDEDGTVISTS
jgi:hypothetical protein